MEEINIHIRRKKLINFKFKCICFKFKDSYYILNSPYKVVKVGILRDSLNFLEKNELLFEGYLVQFVYSDWFLLKKGIR